jgi:hypothetical protein
VGCVTSVRIGYLEMTSKWLEVLDDVKCEHCGLVFKKGDIFTKSGMDKHRSGECKEPEPFDLMKELVKKYKETETEEGKESWLEEATTDLAIIEAMVKHIIDLERWIEDVKPIIKRGG